MQGVDGLPDPVFKMYDIELNAAVSDPDVSIAVTLEELDVVCVAKVPWIEGAEAPGEPLVAAH